MIVWVSKSATLFDRSHSTTGLPVVQEIITFICGPTATSLTNTFGSDEAGSGDFLQLIDQRSVKSLLLMRFIVLVILAHEPVCTNRVDFIVGTRPSLQCES